MGLASIGYGAEEKLSHQDIDPACVHQERW
jgi:hypothetical protein